ncbi:hypothetical protein [Acinetobacter indicus]|uniref:hypothetical protein n=1 Tax=Acinetobacter indicus TaxID=756892 RepID=UPI00209AABC9|nr:hypothetical protein [Acinetobacter indicus]MCO8088210.1 hypothetical protein [Acinetobacter indicus]
MANKEKPILFTGDMVNTIIAGSKTQTRRIIKPQPTYSEKTGFNWNGRMYGVNSDYAGTVRNFAYPANPFGKVGDLLWVRETWSTVNLWGEIAIAYRADSSLIRVVEDKSFQCEDGTINYDDPRLEKYTFSAWADDLFDGKEGVWRPSIHMPRWASRILLRIKDVRVERLMAISEKDAMAEGMWYTDHGKDQFDNQNPGWFWKLSDSPEQCLHTAQEAFGSLWSQTYGAKSWEENPWVWVVDFEVADIRE